MPIQQVLYKRKNGSARYDPAKKAYVGYRIDVLVNGRRHRDGGFSSRREAQDFIDRLKADARDRRNGLSVKTKVPRVSQLLSKRLETMKHDKTIALRVFAVFQSLLETDLRVTEIRTSHFQQYVNSRNVAPGTVRRELNELSAAFHAGAVLYPEELDSYTPPRIPRPRNPKRATRHVITREEKDLIVANLQGSDYQKRVGRMFSLAWYLGLRYGEIVKLKKSDLKGRTLKVVRWKTKDVTLFEDLPDEIINLLKEAIKLSPSEFVFHPEKSHRWLYIELQKAVEAAGLIYGRDRLDGICFHSARHSFVTRAMELGDLATVGSLSAHSDASMVMNYTHSTASKRRDLLRKMYGSEDLKKVYNAVRKGKLSFEEFRKVMR